ncbi:MAG TPA: tetratricopeptide repeat protein [Thermoanaerobaculia bacterium]|nr:tetratricopeptide repeat protein [Thermoanaerobaculia bacterium]
MRRRAAVRLLLLLAIGFGATSVFAKGPPRCQGSDSYEYGLCRYHGGNFEDAERVFRRFLEHTEPSPQAIRARYFLARAEMKQRKWSEASAEWIRIFELDAGFYREWSCDFLLGECRRELGQG